MELQLPFIAPPVRGKDVIAGSGRPTKGYHVGDERVPSVTTILSRFKESGGLVHWAWQLGIEGKDYREERDRAASAGTHAHNLVEAFVRGKPRPEPLSDADANAKAEKSYGAFLEWAAQSQLRVTHTEVPLVSRIHKFGGTIDGILVQNRRAIGDWKTSNGVYVDYLLQIAAYQILWEENFPDEPITGGLHLVRFDKTYGDFSHRWWGELDDAKDAFLILAKAYPLLKKLEKRTK